MLFPYKSSVRVCVCVCVWYLFIICLDYVLRTLIALIKENSFTLRKPRSWRYTEQTITNANNTNNIALLANTPTQAESLLITCQYWLCNKNLPTLALEDLPGTIDDRDNWPESVMDIRWSRQHDSMIYIYIYIYIYEWFGINSTKPCNHYYIFCVQIDFF